MPAQHASQAVKPTSAAAATTSPTGLTGLPLRAAVGRLRLIRVDDAAGVSLDVDTPEDLARARATMETPSSHREDAS